MNIKSFQFFFFLKANLSIFVIIIEKLKRIISLEAAVHFMIRVEKMRTNVLIVRVEIKNKTDNNI